jgi:hypothetical protein
VSCLDQYAMHIETLFESFPDTVALVLVGFTFITFAFVLKRRLVSTRVESTPTHGSASES